MDATARKLPTIRQLPPNLINQIAAGEVIERPASVVKELLENSVDAGSTRIEVSIVGGGTEMIRISDNGCGMTADQLPLALASHATSKLPTDEALFHVSTLGFRGEALASIGSVSQLTIRSRIDGDDAGNEVRVRGGVIEPPVPCGCGVGTVMEVRNLFFNTPVRHRFLKTAQTEKGHIVEAFTRLALANSHIHFVLNNNDKPLYDLPVTERWSERIEAFFGSEIADCLIPINSDDAQIRVSGYVCDPSVSRGNSRMQYLFLNGRHIRDRSLQHALGEAYRGLLMVGRHPVCFLRMSMPAEMIDVNVHPTKLEVRFTDGGRVYSRLLQTLRHHFLTTDMTQRVGPSSPANQPTQSDAPQGPTVPVLNRTEQAHRQSVIEWARTGRSPDEVFVSPNRGGDNMPTNAGPIASQNSMTSLGGVPDFQPYPSGNSMGLPATGMASTGDADFAPDPNLAPWDDPHMPIGDPPLSRNGHPSVCYLGFQVHNRYLVTQDEKGMVVIDQHALHERVLYERVKTKVLDSGQALESQGLLVPETVSLTPAERTAVLEHQDTLRQIGMDIEDFGGETVVIRSYPAMLRKTPPAEMLRTLMESVLGGGKKPEPIELLNHLLSTIACKAAVKAGDPLSPEEIESLLEQKDLFNDTHHCPHGRPTALFFSRDELDRMFGRLGPRGRV
ncbi:DNA mismatch repair endonuclease MutL [Rhodopirellula sp. MGV]|uniref:DNA mismatch repair endonuclease MutL n=1 Tax=Rhodopirellula sp. MGV TaxID=2023130 RepID=UPI000B960D2B|nr:DNA mismatch repair endonuclease MutL [Rhodopirellula sp. MGV]OYP37896.1 DNA mismatch repair protein MutL [Rhodopirellula sp. MGV]PNY37073.1 DNA mismatch repair endonuclease MutL [Rhodopirellula baltica]